METAFVFPGFKGVIDDRAIAGAVNELPHAGGDRPRAANQVRKIDTVMRAEFVNQAVVPA